MTWNNDVFELFFKPADDKPGYYEFQVNAAGDGPGLFLPRRGAGGFDRFIKDGNFHVEAKVHLRGTLNKWTDSDDGWSVEGKIPWTDFLQTGGRPERGETWKFALCRYDYSVDFEGPGAFDVRPAQDAAPSFHRFEDYADPDVRRPRGGSEPPASAGGAALTKRIPMTTSRVVGSPDPPPPYRIQQVYPDSADRVARDRHAAARSRSAGARHAVLDRYDQSQIFRIKDDPKVKTMETLLHVERHRVPGRLPSEVGRRTATSIIGGNGAAKRRRGEEDAHHPLHHGDEAAVQDHSRVRKDHYRGLPTATTAARMASATTACSTSPPATAPAIRTPTSSARTCRRCLPRCCASTSIIPSRARPYAVPQDNPFVNLSRAPAPRNLVARLRNPWRMSLDRKTGHLWLGQNGQDLWEQAYLVKKGDNAGWSVMEGSHPFYPNRKQRADAARQADRRASAFRSALAHRRPRLLRQEASRSCSAITSTAITRPAKSGRSSTTARRSVSHKEICDSRLTITGFGVDSHGEILIRRLPAKKKAACSRWSRRRQTAGVTTFPRKLSDSGLFKSVKGHVMEPALIPYSVNAVLWSDGAAKQRWLGSARRQDRLSQEPRLGVSRSDGDREIVPHRHGRGQSAIAPLDRDALPDPARHGEWYGYSYAWNDEQTEGTLIEAKGADRDFTRSRRKPARRSLNWHYPSRSECMVCHSRAANWVLGFTELQMNHVHDYGGVKENQLARVRATGPLQRFNWTAEARDKLRQEAQGEGQDDEGDQRRDRTGVTRDARPARAVTIVAVDVQCRNLRRALSIRTTRARTLTLRARSLSAQQLFAVPRRSRRRQRGSWSWNSPSRSPRCRSIERQAATRQLRHQGRGTHRAGPSGALGDAAPHRPATRGTCRRWRRASSIEVAVRDAARVDSTTTRGDHGPVRRCQRRGCLNGTIVLFRPVTPIDQPTPASGRARQPQPQDWRA